MLHGWRSWPLPASKGSREMDERKRIAAAEITARRFWGGAVAERPGASAVRSGDRVWSYRDFDNWVNRIANGLREHGAGAGTVIAVLLPTSVRLLRVQLAAVKVGAISVPLIAGSTAPEVAYVLEHSGAEILITDSLGWTTVCATPGLRAQLTVFLDGESEPGTRSLAELERDETSPPEPGIEPLAPMAIMYTSGSTGKPKGVVQPSASLATTGWALADAMGLQPHDNVLCALPLFHTAATHMAFGSAVAAGACLTIADRFSREGFWSLARRSAATASYLFPAQLAILLSAPESPLDRDHLLRVCFSHVRNQPFCDRFGVDIRPGWAMTETCGMGTLTRVFSGDPELPRIGIPYPPDAEVRIVDEAGGSVPADSPGQIEFRHPHVMLRYQSDPVQSDKTLRDGWVASGDIGSIDEHGVVSYHGRIKNVIKRSGENISGEEVERALAAHPAVEEALVFAVPDPLRTEEAYAAVCLRVGREVQPSELRDWCGTRLSSWKVPRYFSLTHDPLPRLANGKTDRGTVRDAADPARAWQISTEGPVRA